jgi:hypothetical protein
VCVATGQTAVGSLGCACSHCWFMRAVATAAASVGIPVLVAVAALRLLGCAGLLWCFKLLHGNANSRPVPSATFGIEVEVSCHHCRGTVHQCWQQQC